MLMAKRGNANGSVPDIQEGIGSLGGHKDLLTEPERLEHMFIGSARIGLSKRRRTPDGAAETLKACARGPGLRM